MKTLRPAPWQGAVPILAALAMAGCRTVIVPPSEQNYTVEANASEQMVLWQVESKGQSTLGERIAERNKQRVQQGLIEKNLRVSEGPADVQVSFSADAEEFDQSGNYYVYAGRASGEVRLRGGGGSPESLIGRLDTQAKGERKLGADDALASLADVLGAQLSTQATGYAAAVRDRIRVEAIAIRLSWLQRQVRSDVFLADYIARFVATVRDMPGVLDCRLLEQDNSASTAQIRVVYLRDAFPHGFKNALIQQPDLNLKSVR